MLTLPNLLSCMRFPLAFVFLQTDPLYRAIAILLAMLTDGLDGFFARRYQSVNRIGTILDPLMDKFFMFFVLSILISENRLSWLEGCFLICRDFSVIIYGLYLALRGRLLQYQFRAIWCGKITTVLQLLVLFALTFAIPLPSYLYGLFMVLGVLALVELYHTDRLRRKTS